MPFKKLKHKDTEEAEELTEIDPTLNVVDAKKGKKGKQKKPKSKLRKIIEWVCTGILLLLIGGCSFVLIYSRVNAPKDKENPNAPIPMPNPK